MYNLPLQGSAARDMFDVADLVEVGAGRQLPVVGIAGARAKGRNFFAVPGGDRAVRRLCYFVLLANDELALCSVGRRMGVKVEWKFGPYKAPR